MNRYSTSGSSVVVTDTYRRLGGAARRGLVLEEDGVGERLNGRDILLVAPPPEVPTISLGSVLFDTLPAWIHLL